jgi:hypothetical protein
MAQTEAQWNKFQSLLPQEDRVSYLEYLKVADPSAYRQLTGAAGIASLKADSLEPKTTVPVSALEGAAQARALEREQRAKEQAEADYANKILPGGLTQAQIDAVAGAKETAGLIGGTIDPKTGYVVSPNETPAQKAAREATQRKIDAEEKAKAAAAAAKAAQEKSTAAQSKVAEIEARQKRIAEIQAKIARGESISNEDRAFLGLGPITAPNATTPTTTTPTTTTPTTTTPTTTTPTTTTPTTTTPTTTTRTTATPTGGFTQKDIDDAVAAALTKASETTADRDKKANALASLTSRFSQYGLQSLIPKIRELVISGATEATIALELAETEEYKKRFKANTDRLKKGLSVLDPGTYIGMEDSYRQALRAYGLKQFDTDDYVSQFIANDISANELSNRIVTAVQRVQNADPAITSQLREFYNIGQNDLVAYVLDPNQQFQRIERQVQAAEIGVAARRQGLQTGVGVAEQLAAQGVTQAEAQKGYATIADILPDAKKLSEIYGTTLEGYDQSQGEQEVFNQLASAQRRRQKLTQREIAQFSGQSGLSTKALTTDLTGQY